MDRFKEKTLMKYDSWDLRCPFVCQKRQTRRRLIKLIRRKARRNLKQDLRRNGE